MRSTFPVDAIEFCASGQASTPGSGHRLRRQALSLLVAAALEDEAAGLRLHPLAEAVGASPLALLGLIRALHAKDECSPESFGRISALIAGPPSNSPQRSTGPVVCSPLLVMPDRRTPPKGADSPCLKTSRRHGTRCAKACAQRSPISSFTSGSNR